MDIKETFLYFQRFKSIDNLPLSIVAQINLKKPAIFLFSQKNTTKTALQLQRSYKSQAFACDSFVSMIGWNHPEE